MINTWKLFKEKARPQNRQNNCDFDLIISLSYHNNIYQQWATTEEAIEDPYDEHDVVEVNQDEVVTDWGNDEVDFQEQVCKWSSNVLAPWNPT